jgi:hypothetical protein
VQSGIPIRGGSVGVVCSGLIMTCLVVERVADFEGSRTGSSNKEKWLEGTHGGLGVQELPGNREDRHGRHGR